MNKYRNKRTVVDGISFASKREANRYSELALLETVGKDLQSKNSTKNSPDGKWCQNRSLCGRF